MDLPAMSARRWVSAAVSVALIAGVAVLGSRALGGPSGQRIELAADADDRAAGDGAAGRTVDVGSEDGPAETAPAEAGASTTTMPPRALPERFAPISPGPLLGKVIVVDPGHNGQNYRYSDVHRAGSLEGDGPLCNTAGSSTNAGLDEMKINWEVGTRLGTMLRRLGAEVILTHADLDGFGPCADERGAIARDNNAAAFVSIHADGSGAGNSGFHVIFPAAHPNLDPAVVGDSGRLARLVRDELLVIGGRPANYVGTGGVQERGDLANLNTANRPSILAELGNLKHPTDAGMLSTDLSYTQIARALARGVVRFLGVAADSPLIAADVTGDAIPDLLFGAPQLVTTTTQPGGLFPTVPGAPATVPGSAPAGTAPAPAGPGATNPPATNPPATNPPATNPPATNPPATAPASTAASTTTEATTTTVPDGG